ncbi:MAG: LamG domain-containing protein, partial [Planctomycetes bacterium]|nr:LamG domain-containing protein [Planctomycetota bacterium]
MCKKLIYLLSVVLLLGSIVQAEDIKWTDLGADHLWSTPENWDLGRVPALDDEVLIDVPAAAAPNGPVIQDGIDAKAKGLWTEAPGEPMLTITGGTLEVAEWIWWGDGDGSFGIMEMSGGTLTTGSEFELGWGGGAGTLTMTGGTINAFEAVIPTGSGAFGELFLNGGTFNVTTAGGLSVKENGIVDITEGTLVLEGDDTAKVNDLIAAGLITAFGGDGQFELDFDGRNAGKTTLTAGIEKAVLFAEDFEGLALGPNVDEELAGDAVWTDTPPEGWIVDESGIPGLGMDETDGVTEWAGWAFADKAWWTEAAGDQDRSLFELGSGTVAVADPDEWDDGERLPIPIAVDPYDTWLTTPDIKIGSAEPGTLELKFDSSWRPEFDDNLHQTANITASFDGGDPVEVMLWESDEASANYKPYATNETVVVKLDAPEGAKKVVLTFGLFDAGNDWWWAIDNIEVRGVVLDMNPVDPGTDGLLASYALDGDATDGSGNGIDGIITNAETGGLGVDGSVWVDDPDRGTVISFNGTAEGAFVRAGEIPQMTLTNDFTWSFWANHSEENTADNDIIFGNRMDETPTDFVPRQFIKFTPTKFEWHMNGNGDDNLDYDDIPADVWLHHTVVKSADQLTYYRNGVEHSSGVFTQPLDVPQPLFFGGDNEGSAGENWSGLMSDVAIYERALSEAEVRYLAGQRAVPVDPGNTGLLGFWTCDEGEGAVVGDSSGNGRDGTIVNGDPVWVEGVHGSAVELVGPTLVEIPPLDLELSEATMAGWIKPNGAQPDWSSIIMTRDPGPATGLNILGFQLAYHWNDTSSSWGFRGGDMIAEDDWTFAAVTIEPDKATFYVNGEAGSVNEVTHDPILWNSNIYLGGDGTAGWVSRRMNGALDDVVIYDRALSAGEIRYLAGARLMDDLLGPDVTGLGDVVQGVPNDGDWPGAET